MGAANESQGLKIAVAAFISLTVMLAVTSYFLYSNVASAQARLDFALVAERRAKLSANLALSQYDEMRTKVGTRAEEFDAAKAEISTNFKTIDERLNNLMSTVNGALQTAEQNGAQGPELEGLKLKVQTAIASYRNEPNKTYISSLNRLTEAMENLAVLTTQLSLKYAAVQKSLERATSVPKGQKDRAPRTKDEAPKTKD